MMDRRRALMEMGGSPEDSPDYVLSNLAVEAGQIVDTEFHPFVAGKGFTVLFDMTTTGQPTSGVAKNWLFIYIHNTAAGKNTCIGKGGTWATTIRAQWLGGSYASGDGSSASAGRHRIAVTHQPNGNTIAVKGRRGTGSVYTINPTSGFPYQNSSADTLKLGGPAADYYELPPGTINLVKIYSKVLSTEEIDAFLA